MDIDENRRNYSRGNGGPKVSFMQKDKNYSSRGGRSYHVSSEDRSGYMAQLEEENRILREQLGDMDGQGNAFVAMIEAQELGKDDIISNFREPKRRLAYFGILGIVATCLFLMMLPLGVSGDYNICGRSRGAHPISLPSGVTCVPPSSDQPISFKAAEIWVPRTNPVIRVGFKCQIERHTICTRVGLLGSLGSRGIVLDDTEYEPITASECNEIVSNIGNRNITISIESHHDDLLSAHFGFRKTLEKIRSRYWWRSLFSDVKRYCANCMGCATRKRPHQHTKMPLTPQVTSEPFQTVIVDSIGPLPLSERGNKHVILFFDHFSKFVEGEAIPDLKAETIARVFVRRICLRHSSPQKLLSDKHASLMSELLEEICHLMNTRKENSVAYRPQTQGACERYNQTLYTSLSMYVSQSTHRDWDYYLDFCIYAYNTSRQDSTGFSPFHLIYGHEPRLPIEAALIPPSVYQVDMDTYVHELRGHLSNAWILAKENSDKARARQKIQYDKTSNPVDFPIGSLVLVKNPVVPSGKSSKFLHSYHGPYKVISEVDNGSNLMLRLVGKSQSYSCIKVHKDQCKYYSFVAPSGDIVSSQSHGKESVKPQKNGIYTVGKRSQRYNLRPRKF